ncbi:Spindle assembly abnormal protein 6 [Chytridiales sp. JEL 0842]|nr:Spindle assembly abnormal protein 6 [Chytridiales sp. JEL 0842]
MMMMMPGAVTETDVLFSANVAVFVKALAPGSTMMPHATTSPHSNYASSSLSTSGSATHLAGLAASQGLASSPTSLPASSNVTLETRRHTVHFHMALSSPSAGRMKMLELRLTDESDPFFLYHLTIGEDDFHTLRTEQNLLVDFLQFPLKLIELLEECNACKSDENPKFIAQFTMTGSSQPATLSIIETNTFKHIIHLSMTFAPGNDASVKQYLAAIVKEQKAENASLRFKLQNTNDTLSARLREAIASSSAVSSELEKLKIAHAEQASKLQLTHSQQLSEEKERLIKEKDMLRTQLEREKRDMERMYEDQIKSLSHQNASTSATYSQLISRSQSLEANLSEESKRASQLSKDYAAAQQELDHLRASQAQLARHNGDLAKEVESLRDRLRKMEEKERDTEENAKKWEGALEGSKEQRAKLEETIEKYRVQNSKLDESLKKAMEEITKGNEIIRRIQSELKSAKSKIKLKNVVTLQQEKLLDERASIIDLQQKDIASLKDQLSKKEEECSDMKKKVEELTKNLDEGKKIIADNNQVIEWLHKQLNEEAMRPTVIGSTVHSYPKLDFDRYSSRKEPKDTISNLQNLAPHYTPSSANPLTTTTQHHATSPYVPTSPTKSSPKRTSPARGILQTSNSSVNNNLAGNGTGLGTTGTGQTTVKSSYFA